jgi:hypothetical protein
VSARASRVGRAAAVLLVVALGMSCGETGSGPNVPFSIEFLPQQLPSLLVGDQLHDTLGNVDSLRAVVFNSSGDTIHDAAIKYVHADTSTIVAIDATSGHVTASDTGFARVVAQASGLQAPPETLWVVQRPTVFANTTDLNTTLISAPVRDSIFALTTSVMNGTAGVDHWRVEYNIIYPAGLDNSDSTHILLSDENRKFSLVDTTGTGTAGISGAATRYLYVSKFANAFVDSVVVEARAFFPDHSPIPGSPIRFKVDVNIPR